MEQKGVGGTVNFRHMYNVSWQGGVYELEREQTVVSPSVNTDYTLAVISQNGVAPKYLSINNGVTLFYSGVEFTVNGISRELMVDIYALDF